MESSLYQDRLKIYDEIVAKCPRFERKGKSMPYTSANGYMFSLLNKSAELGFRFDEVNQAKYINEWKTTLFHSHGAVIKGYVLIPNDILKKQDLLVKCLNESYDYVMSLKPK